MDFNPVGALAAKVGDIVTRYFPPELDKQKFLLEVQKEADVVSAQMQAELTRRQQADMTSDSWLSKNIRPGAFVWVSALLTAEIVGAWIGHPVPDTYFQLTWQGWMAFASIYAVVRGAEKGMKMWSNTK